MKRLGEQKAIEPDAIFSPRHQGDARTGVHVTGMDGVTRVFERLEAQPSYHPDSVMRSRGYTRNPARCPHNQKRYSVGSGWRCIECGEPVE